MQCFWINFLTQFSPHTFPIESDGMREIWGLRSHLQFSRSFQISGLFPVQLHSMGLTFKPRQVIICHVFQNALVTSNKMEPKKRRHIYHSFCASASGVIETPFIRGFQKLTVRTNQPTSQERAWNTSPENAVIFGVQFCLRSLGPFERCVLLHSVHRFYADFFTERGNSYWSTSI